MGSEVVPYLLEDLASGNYEHWFWALHALTGARPVPEEDRGNIRKMAKRWVDWGASRGLLAPRERDPGYGS
jgi:hypothetical protein